MEDTPATAAALRATVLPAMAEVEPRATAVVVVRRATVVAVVPLASVAADIQRLLLMAVAHHTAVADLMVVDPMAEAVTIANKIASALLSTI